MGNENGEWILHGMEKEDPDRIRTVDEALAFINKIGFLPLFANGVKGFSLEEHTYGPDWWSDDPSRDPWMWRQILARSGKVAYAKFFDKKAGFISLSWLGSFANAARDGYDFDSRADQGIAPKRQLKIMNCFAEAAELPSYELKEKAGFYKGGEKNFEGTLTALQEHTYLVVKDFRQKKNKMGLPYGWHIAVYATPESLFGEERLSSDYARDPALSRAACIGQVKRHFGAATEREIAAVLCPNFTKEFAES